MFFVRPGFNTDHYIKVGQRDAALLTAAMVNECVECGRSLAFQSRVTFESQSALTDDTYLTVVGLSCAATMADRIMAAERNGA